MCHIQQMPPLRSGEHHAPKQMLRRGRGSTVACPTISWNYTTTPAAAVG